MRLHFKFSLDLITIFVYFSLLHGQGAAGNQHRGPTMQTTSTIKLYDQIIFSYISYIYLMSYFRLSNQWVKSKMLWRLCVKLFWNIYSATGRVWRAGHSICALNMSVSQCSA